jgi:diacylglycerol kinase family enzyme
LAVRPAISTITAVSRSHSPLHARVAAAVALAGFVALLVELLLTVVRDPLVVIVPLVSVAVGIPVAWLAATRQRFRLPLAIAAVVLVVGGFGSLLAADRGAGYFVAVALTIVVASIAGGLALRWEMRAAVAQRWARAAPAHRGVLLMNPKSGGGKVERFDLVDACRQRGIEPVVLEPGDNPRELAEAAVARGADVIGMAGGDGSLAIVASVAAAHDVAFVCVPAGTRNHLALDLGVDRDDVIGALDAYGPARQARMDLAEVNGQVFVNNVSLGVYADVVASKDYRDAKLQTAAKMLPNLLGPDALPSGLRVHVTGSAVVEDPQVVMVSNDPYRLQRLAGFGSRAHLDRGVLGVAALRLDGAAAAAKFITAEAAGRVDRFPGWQSWQVGEMKITSAGTIAAGIDGESVELSSPLRFATRPLALIVRIAPQHPGVSPAARRPGWGRSTFLGLARVLIGRSSGLIDGGPQP